MMPVIDGLDLLRAVRGDERLRDVPVILLSARAGEESRVEGLDAGADDYLAKPFSARELLARVGALLELTQMRREAEQTLREREEQLRLATDAAEVGLWDIDITSDTLFWPPRVKAMFGISPHVPVSMADFYSGLHPDDRESTAEAFAAALDPVRRAVYDVEYRTVGKEDGVIRWVAAKGRGIFDASEICVRVIGTAMDITARKRAEERLREETRVQELLGGVSHALIAAQLDTQKVVQIVTDAATELSGASFGAFFYNVQDGNGEWYSLYTLSGAPREAFARFPQPRNTDVFGPTFRGEGVVRSDDITVDPRYGKNPPYRGMPEGHLPVRAYLAVPVKTSSGQVLGGLFFGHPEAGVFDERAERLVLAIAAQAAVALDNASLHQASQHEIEQRKRIEAALDEANRRKDEFLAMLAHELRNPLSPIGTASELLARTVGDDPRAHTAIGMIKRQVTQLTRLVDDLLDVSRITQGRIGLRKRPTELVAVITQAIETVEPQLRDKGHTLSVHASSYESLYVMGDFARLVQCVGNILTNAIKYTEPAGEISIHPWADEGWAYIAISDSGAGISRRAPAEGLRPFRAGRAHARSLAGRAWCGTRGRQAAGGDARGCGACSKRRSRQGIHVRDPLAADRPAGGQRDSYRPIHGTATARADRGRQRRCGRLTRDAARVARPRDARRLWREGRPHLRRDFSTRGRNPRHRATGSRRLRACETSAGDAGHGLSATRGADRLWPGGGSAACLGVRLRRAPRQADRSGRARARHQYTRRPNVRVIGP